MNSYDKRHAIQVVTLAKKLCEAVLPCDENIWKLLETASLMHDISDIAPHNKTGAKMVLENGVDGLSKRETLIVANLIRYHRGSNPKDTHKLYALLDDKEKILVQKLSAILRLADVLDYGHYSHADDIEIILKKDKLELTIHPDPPHSKGFDVVFETKKKLFEEVFEKKVCIMNF